MKFKLIPGLLCLVLAPVLLTAQTRPDVKFGKVSAKDFATTVYEMDTSAAAVVIADIGSTHLEGNSKGWFSVESKHYKRVHVLRKSGFDIADVSIPVYDDGDIEVKLSKIKAVTYNLENGKVNETKLDTKSGIFTEKIDKNWKVKKFTFPNVKEGCIIEFEYTTMSDDIRYLDGWEFQGTYPRLWSEFNLEVPSFFQYNFISQGYRKFDINTHKDRSSTFTIVVPNGGTISSDTYTISAGVTETTWAIENVPALKEENFTSTLKNHIQKIDFQLVEQREPLQPHRYVESWVQVAKRLMENEYFGFELTKDNGWLRDVVNPLTDNINDNLQKAKNIYTYVRDNFSCTDYSGKYMDQNLRGVVKTKKGNVAEINMLLTAMMKYAGLNASPVILSTRSHGVTFAAYPLLTQYNYVITRIRIEGADYFLDATEPHLGFGHLPLRCYNGHARVIDETAYAIELNSNFNTEAKTTSVFIINNEKGEMTGSVQQIPGYYNSTTIKDKVKENGKSSLETEFKKDFGQEISISRFAIDSLDNPDAPVKISFNFDLTGEKEDIIYLNPMFGFGFRENIFKAAERFYPVELPYNIDETYNLQLQVPEGYVTDELPKSLTVKLNEKGEGVFEYQVSQSGSTISLRSRIRISRTYFAPEEYQMLREFFNFVVKKHAEQIVFKKK